MTSNRQSDAVRHGAAVVTTTAPPAETVKQPSRSLAELHADKDATRLRLAQTLDAIEDRMNVPKKLKRVAGTVAATLHESGRERPLVLLAIAAGAAGLIGTTVWWLVSRFTRS